jgi:hypothetical protein
MIELTPTAAGQTSAWVALYGDWSLAVSGSGGTGAGETVLERRPTSGGDPDIERVASITAVAGVAQLVRGTEYDTAMVYRLRALSVTTAGAVVRVRTSGLIQP